MLNSYLATLHINNSIHTSQYDTDRHKFKSRDNWYLTLQLLDSLLQNSNGIFVHGGVYVPLGGISACKKHFSFWILIQTNHLSMCYICLGRMKGKRMWCSKKWLWIAQKLPVLHSIGPTHTNWFTHSKGNIHQSTTAISILQAHGLTDSFYYSTSEIIMQDLLVICDVGCSITNT